MNKFGDLNRDLEDKHTNGEGDRSHNPIISTQSHHYTVNRSEFSFLADRGFTIASDILPARIPYRHRKGQSASRAPHSEPCLVLQPSRFYPYTPAVRPSVSAHLEKQKCSIGCHNGVAAMHSPPIPPLALPVQKK